MQPVIPDGNMSHGILYQAQNGGYTFWTQDPGGEDIDIDEDYYFVIGTVKLRSNCRHDIRFGDRLWYALVGTGMLHPNVMVYSNYFTNRNYGPPNTLRRSNTATVGRMDEALYGMIHCQRPRAGWDRSGPRPGQHYKPKIHLKVCHVHKNQARVTDQAAKGWFRTSVEIDVVAYWRR